VTNRWQLYQRERFPILTYAPLIAAFSFSAVSVSAFLRGQGVPAEARGFLVAFISVFLFFLQLRIADEFKDHEDDARFRPYRPVPRGLVTLPELGTLSAGFTHNASPSWMTAAASRGWCARICSNSATASSNCPSAA